MKPQTHEERLAREIDRCRQLARELGLLSTENYLAIAATKLKAERVERSRNVTIDSRRATK
jgi:hypothetical protein